MVSSRAVCAALFALGLGLAAAEPSARASEVDAAARMAARELAVSGAEAFDQQDFRTALIRFQRAESLYKAPSIGVMVARCLARVGRIVEAVNKYEETLSVPLTHTAPEAYRRAVADATAEVEGVRARVARLELRLPVNAPEAVQVWLDGVAVPPALLGMPQPVNPGSHHVAARSPGRKPYSREVTLAEGAHQPLELELPFDDGQPDKSKQLAASTAEGESRLPSVLTWSFLAGGGVALVVGGVTGIAALNHKANLDKVCSPGCPASMESELDSFRATRTLSYLGFGVGLAAAGVGTYFLLHEGSSGGQVLAVVLPTGAAVTGKF